MKKMKQQNKDDLPFSFMFKPKHDHRFEEVFSSCGKFVVQQCSVCKEYRSQVVVNGKLRWQKGNLWFVEKRSGEKK